MSGTEYSMLIAVIVTLTIKVLLVTLFCLGVVLEKKIKSMLFWVCRPNIEIQSPETVNQALTYKAQKQIWMQHRYELKQMVLELKQD